MPAYKGVYVGISKNKGLERVVFIDKRDFEGPLFVQIEEAYEFVLKHINLGAEIIQIIHVYRLQCMKTAWRLPRRECFMAD